MRREPSNFKLDIVSQKEEETKAPDTSSETKKMTGFKDISDVAAAAPEKASSAGTATPSRSSTTRAKRQTEEQKKEEKRDAAVEEALAKVGTEMMKELACLPYEAWALFFADPDLKLNEEEAKSLANSYFLIAKALKPEQLTSWKVLLALALLQNFRLVMKKGAAHSEKVERSKKQQKAMASSVNLEGAEVSIV